MSELHEWAWPVADAKGAVVIVHGLGEHAGRYDHVARALNAAGYACYARDIRGHGRSAGAPGDMGNSLEALVDDVVRQCAAVRDTYDRTFLLAHSMGTMISMPAVTKLQATTLSGLILSGVAIEPGPATGDLVNDGAVPPTTLSRDPDVVQAYTDDPLVWDNVPSDVVGLLLEMGQVARDAVPMIEIPVLLIHGVDDQLCDIAGANYVHTQLVGTDKTLLGYEGLLHEVLNEPERDKVLADVIGWLDQH